MSFWYSLVANQWATVNAGRPVSDWTSNTVDDINFLEQTLQTYLSNKEQPRILDSCCGWGRHALGMARKGYNVIGVDLADQLISEASSLMEEETTKGVARFFVCDYRHFSVSPPFDFIYFMHDVSLVSFENSETEISDQFRIVNQNLAMNGVLLFGDNRYAPYACSFRKEESTIELREGRLHEIFEYNAELRLVTRHFVLASSCEMFLAGRISYRIYSLNEIDQLLQEHGFYLIDAHNDYLLGPFNPSIPGLIIRARKVAEHV